MSIFQVCSPVIKSKLASPVQSSASGARGISQNWFEEDPEHLSCVYMCIFIAFSLIYPRAARIHVIGKSRRVGGSGQTASDRRKLQSGRKRGMEQNERVRNGEDDEKP